MTIEPVRVVALEPAFELGRVLLGVERVVGVEKRDAVDVVGNFVGRLR